METTTAIQVDKLTHRYGTHPVLEDICLTIPKGAFFIIIGPNGSGKTTLMKIISGNTKPTRGEVTVMGKPAAQFARKALARIVAMVPQMTAVDFPFTVQEVVLMGRTPHQGLLGIHNETDLRIATKAMAFTRVEHLAKRKLDQLSGGEQQRVFIARAICQEPEIILLDEPTAALDLAHQVRVMDLMEKLQSEKGVTVVMVSHDVNLAAMYAKSLLLLKEGRILGTGTPTEVLTYKTLEKAYGCTLLVDQSPLGAFPRVTLVPQRYIGRI